MLCPDITVHLEDNVLETGRLSCRPMNACDRTRPRYLTAPSATGQGASTPSSRSAYECHIDDEVPDLPPKDIGRAETQPIRTILVTVNQAESTSKGSKSSNRR